MLKMTNSGLCRTCYYLKRASLNNMRISELVTHLNENESFKDKSLGKIGFFHGMQCLVSAECWNRKCEYKYEYEYVKLGNDIDMMSILLLYTQNLSVIVIQPWPHMVL